MERDHPIRAVAIVALLVGAGLAAAYAASEALAPVYGESRDRYRRAVAEAPELEALSLGNSHSRAIDFGTLGLQGANLANPGNDFYEVLHILRSIRPRVSNVEYVFLPISLFVNDNSTDYGRSDVRRQAYVVTGNYEPVAGDRALAFQAWVAPVVRADNWRGVGGATYRLLRGRNPRARAAPQGRGLGEGTKAPPVRVIRRSAVRKVALHGGWEQHSLAHNPRLCEEVRQALREIARLSAPAHLVLYTPPYPPTYLRHYEEANDEAAGCHLDRFAAELAAASSSVSYFDDRAMAPFTDGSGLFRDGDHVNRAGARAYSRVLADRLGLR